MGGGICGKDSIEKERHNKQSNLSISNEKQKVNESNNNFIKKEFDKIYKKKDLSDDYNKSDIFIQGLKNIGNSCYMNSFIQILLHCPHFLEYLKQEEKLMSMNNKSLVKYLIRLSEEYNKNYLVEIRKIMEGYYNDFSENKQCDSQDFGNKLIDRIIKEIKCQNDSSSYTSKSSKINYLDKYFKEEIRLEKLFTLIEKSNNINSNFENIIISISYEINLNFTEIKNNRKYNLVDLLNSYYINKKIVKCPKILIITIERAFLNEGYNTKNLKYPHKLNMGKYYEKNKDKEYILFALNKKSGDSKDFGHYFCNINIKDSWYTFSDDKVTKQEQENIPGVIVGFFYYRKK